MLIHLLRACCIGLLWVGAALAYDPLAVPATEPEILDLTVTDPQRRRDIPLRVYLPALRGAPVVLFSHGLGGSRTGSAFLGRHWAARGYLAVFLQHPGSDSSVWRDQPLTLQRMSAMQQAASLENFRLRVQDVSAVIDQLAQWNNAPVHALRGRMDLQRLGMSGHSFGAITTQAMAGQQFLGQQRLADPRIRAAVIMSPSSPRRGDVDRAFGAVQIPWLLMTGTKDVAVIGNIDMASRLAVYPALPAGGKYELVLDGAQHSVFTDHALPGDQGIRQPKHHAAILALSTAFWDAWLRRDAAARRWLDGESTRSVLAAADRWQHK